MNEPMNSADSTTISFARDIVPLFTLQDTICMNGMGVELDNYEYMSNPMGDDKYADHANANHVYARLTGDEQPQMPLGEAPWNAPDNANGQKNLQIFRKWMTFEPTYQP